MLIFNDRHFLYSNHGIRSTGIVVPDVQKMVHHLEYIVFVMIPIMCISPNEIDV